ncbi:E3 ubiquitin-protein ligase arih1l-like isoform X2 [Contarinia nasturtii]|uniref:E3 ubiquitin-protein ligase arih1l-like isoform X2 n=1 Tax=Contarinia nasturtii TaxID=265458 RepID=UPI0012D3EE41|nr:E3 ubiquitin-protein ligase arih1l-like isoform X2 [Contarinia nasturtii]
MDSQEYIDDDSDHEISVSEQPQFKSITSEEIIKLMNQSILGVNSVVEMPATTARILLSHTKWDVREVLDRITDDNCDKFFEKAHVQNPFESPKMKRKSNTEHTCTICFMDFQQNEIVGLSCDHEYCKECWSHYLTSKIMDDGHSEFICCPEYKCQIVVDDGTIMEVLTDSRVLQKYEHLMTNSFVEHTYTLRWCPSAQCSLAIKAECLLDYRQNCECKCGKRFCFSCGEEPHDPIPCDLMKCWSKNDNDETIEYLIKHTKSCPKCFALIEKNGGCNHMSCRKCKYEFCWLCFGPWSGHAVNNCNKYKDSNKNITNDQNRWEHYFTRYGGHRKSLKIEMDMKERIICRMEHLQDMGKSWNDVQSLMKALDILFESRRQLMFTYIFAYFTKPHNQKNIFEVNQADLESATEALSNIFESDLHLTTERYLSDVQDKSCYCEARMKTMQCHIYEGFDKNWWSFTSG